MIYVRWVFVLIAGIMLMVHCHPVIDIEAEYAKVQINLGKLMQAYEDRDAELLSQIVAKDGDIVILGPGFEGIFIGWESYQNEIKKWFDRLEEIDIVVRDQHITINNRGEIAWFSEFIDIGFDVNGRSSYHSNIRFTGVMERRGVKWFFVQMHMSLPVSIKMNG